MLYLNDVNAGKAVQSGHVLAVALLCLVGCLLDQLEKVINNKTLVHIRDEGIQKQQSLGV